MEKMLNNWGIDKQRVHIILRDNAANMKKAMRDMGVPSVGCVAHSCQLCVHEGLLSQRSVTETLARARKIVGHFKLPVGLLSTRRHTDGPKYGYQAPTARCTGEIPLVTFFNVFLFYYYFPYT